MEYYSSLDASKLDSETPTLFEIISANQLEALLSPSLRYILVYYAQRYPGHLLKITNRFDELNLLFRSFIEWYFLKYWNGSFTENFYGIKRISQTPLSDKRYNASKLAQLTPSMMEERRSLTSLQTAVSILEITGMPYIQEKCNYHYELLYSKFITNQLSAESASSAMEAHKLKIQALFVKIYPYLQSFLRLANLLTTLSYLSGASKSPSLLTFIFKVNYARLNQYDYSRNEKPMTAPGKMPNRVSPPSNIEQTVSFLRNYVAKPSLKSSKYVMGTFFPLAIFSLKFLEWWNSSSFAQTVAKSQRNELEDHIPAPSLLKALVSANKKQSKIYKSGSVCPLCRDEIQNPAIIETGHVFCYTCIFNYLRDSHKIVRAKETAVAGNKDDSEGKDDSEISEGEKEAHENNTTNEVKLDEASLQIERGGRCPITGQKLLGCRWNEATGEFEINGIRRLIF